MGIVFETTDKKKAVIARDDFLSIASHELRTPLTSLFLQLQMILRNSTKAPGESIESILPKLELASRQAKQLGESIDGLLDVSRIGTGRIVLNKEILNLTHRIQLHFRGLDSFEK